LLDGNKIEVPEGEEVGVEDIIVKALSGRSTSALAAFQEFLKKLAKDKKYDSVMIATMGARGIVDETVIKKSIEEINKLLPAEKDPAVILDLLLMKADLYLELGDYKQARIIYEELKTRDKNRRNKRPACPSSGHWEQAGWHYPF
jgi:tetratricopeptide (TPR) repeat protein